ncbi:MAG: asparagine--tRNA ligase [Planctomycetes bacterium]|nr:asparagine--tRNA ligase [Planctomycetota bacterium]
MSQTYIVDLKNNVGQSVTIKGWLYNKRSSGKIKFLQVRDGTGIVQGVMAASDVSPEVFKQGDGITQESSLEVTGTVRADKRAPGGYELTLSNVKVIQIAETYPITPKEHGTGFLMENRHLWIRSRKQTATLKVRAELVRAIREFFDDRGFVLVDTPILTPAACEGTTTLFEVEYFGDKAYLTQSGQLYNEATAAALGKTYCFGPTFRAEKSKTRKHLMEFWMVEPEIAYADLDDVMKLSEEFIVFIIQRVLKNRREDLEILERDIAALEKIKLPFPRVAYPELVKLFKEWGHDFVDGNDLGAPEETVIGKKFDQPVMIHRFPMKVKAFYMKADPKNPDLALCVDVIAPEGFGELIGGGQREDNLKTLEKKIKEHKLPANAFKWYLDLRRYGSVPHGGFGLGLERTVAWLCGSEHIRECIPFPRMLYKIYP